MNFSNLKIDIDFNAVFTYLTSNEVQEFLLPVKIAFLAISAVLLFIIIFVLLRTNYLKWLFVQDIVQFITKRPFGAKQITRQWNQVLRRLETGNESEYKLALIEADDMLDVALKRMGYGGATLEEKLGKITSATVRNIQQLYDTHRLRNNIVHDPDHRLTISEVRRALDEYAQAFMDLQILAE